MSNEIPHRVLLLRSRSIFLCSSPPASPSSEILSTGQFLHGMMLPTFRKSSYTGALKPSQTTSLVSSDPKYSNYRAVRSVERTLMKFEKYKMEITTGTGTWATWITSPMQETGTTTDVMLDSVLTASVVFSGSMSKIYCRSPFGPCIILSSGWATDREVLTSSDSGLAQSPSRRAANLKPPRKIGQKSG